MTPAEPPARWLTSGPIWTLGIALFISSGAGTCAGATEVTPGDMAVRARACTVCHGDEGRAGPDGFYPRLAGKPAAYLHDQLLHFRDGRRQYALMRQLLEPLNDAYLLEFANYFAARRAPYPAPGGTPADAALLRRGQGLVQQGDPGRKLPACVACHGDKLAGIEPDVPGLLGLPKDYIAAQLGAWQAGTRKARAPDCMAQVARQLTPSEVSAVSTWLSAQTVPQTYAPAPRRATFAVGPVSVPACGARALASPS